MAQYSQGFGLVQTGAADTSYGTLPWTAPTNITADDGSNAFASGPISGTEDTNYLKGTNVGFTIPADAIIRGIEVRMEKQGSAFGTNRDVVVRLVKAGVPVGLSKDITTNWGAAPITVTYGNDSNLWGTTWTPAEINSSGFGVVLSARVSASLQVDVDYMKIKVHYDLPKFVQVVTPSGYASGNVMYKENGGAWTAVAAEDFYFATNSSDNATTVPYASMDPGAIMRDIMDKYRDIGGTLNYDSSTIELTGTTVSYTFNTNTTLEGLKKCLELAPAGWYFYVDQATNMVHFHQKNETADQIFTLGSNIINARAEKRSEDIVNYILFSGGGDPKLFKRFQDTVSSGRYGIRVLRYNDERVTVAATAQAIADSILETRSMPEVRLSFEVSDNNVDGANGLDLESITLGEMAGFRSFGDTASSLWDVAVWDVDYWDYSLKALSTLTLQMVRIERLEESCRIYCSTVPPDVSKRIEDIVRNLQATQTADNPNAPS